MVRKREKKTNVRARNEKKEEKNLAESTGRKWGSCSVIGAGAQGDWLTTILTCNGAVEAPSRVEHTSSPPLVLWFDPLKRLFLEESVEAAVIPET